MGWIRWRRCFSPMKDIYGSRLKYGGTTTNTVSDPSLSRYLRVHQISPNNQFYNGYFFTEAHYLSPIATEHFLISSSDGQSTETSPIYQNPGWPVTAGAGPIGY